MKIILINHQSFPEIRVVFTFFLLPNSSKPKDCQEPFVNGCKKPNKFTFLHFYRINP